MILITAKQEKTINPDTRLHSDEMREKRGGLQEIQGREHHWKRRKGHVWGTGASINAVRL